MAAINISSLKYQPVGPNSKKWAAQTAMQAVNVYTVNLQNAQGRDDQPIHLHYATIDNGGASNSQPVPVQLGTYSFSVPPFTRETFELPDGLTNLVVSVAVGAVTLTVSEDRLAADQTNSLAVQQTAAATLTYQFITYAANQNQLADDVNKSILFQPTAADMTYQLMLGSTAGNGFLSLLHNEGTKIVNIAATAPNVINGALANVFLLPGEKGMLSGDGNNWHFAPQTFRNVDVILEEQKVAGVDAGAYPVAGGIVRQLNTLVYDPNGYATGLAAGKFAIPAGTWDCAYSAPALSVGTFQAYLYNDTDAAFINLATSEFSSNAGFYAQARSHGRSIFTITAPKVIYLGFQAGIVQLNTAALGASTSIGAPNRYSRLELLKIA